MNKKNFQKACALGLATLMLGVFTHCVSESPSNSSSSSRNPSSESSTSTDSTSKPSGVAAVTVSTGVKNHEQLLHTMAAVTGIPANNTAVLTVYNQVAATLPTTNDVKSLLAPNNVAIVKLAAEFCNQLIEGGSGGTARTAIYNTAIPDGPGVINFASVTRDQLLASNLSFVQRTVDAFWGGIISESDLLDAEAELTDLLIDLASEEATNNNAAAKKVAKGVCTAVLSSAYVTLL
jgi:hypothetical protein